MKAKKHLGQHFLNSEDVVNTIVERANIAQGETVLEIGPGQGVLTRALLAAGAHVVAVEKDTDMIEILSKEFKKEIDEHKLKLIHGDILAFDTHPKLTPHTWKLVANIPYYITGEILRTFLSVNYQPSTMVLLVQKEVAERIVGANGKESILSLSVKLYGTPAFVREVPRELFTPAPAVDSAVLEIAHIGPSSLSNEKEAQFFALVKKGFSQKRKLLLNTLPPLVERDIVRAFLVERGYTEKARAEELSMHDWKALVERV